MDLSREKKQRIRAYYLQEDVMEEMVRIAKHREFAPTYPHGYGKRPDAVNFPGDFTSFVEKGAVAFHGSVERWRNPHLIDTVSDSDSIRTGWDLVMDIDCDRDFAFAKVAARELVETLHDFGVEHVSVKFSGNRGFHVGVRGEAFPDKVEGKEWSAWYPELPQAIVNFLRSQIKDDLINAFLDMDSETEELMREAAENQGEDGLDPFGVCDVENNWGDRHLFRMPYSINEKSWLVSLPLAVDDIDDFEKEDAAFEDISVEETFLDDYEDGEATELAIEALDWRAQHRDDDEERASFDGEFTIPGEAIPEEDFPPTIHNILEGLEDGRKRALFILITFFAHCGYDWESIEGMIWEWNDRNEEPLKQSYVQSQLNWHKAQDEPLMPPNFDADGFYRDIGVYEEDPLTENVNNPVSYAFAKAQDDDDEDDSGGSDKELVECPYCGKEYKGETKWYKDHVMECDG